MKLLPKLFRLINRLNGEVQEFHHEDCAQVMMLFVFCSIALVILLGLVLNTVKQTSRRIEMQGAADAGSIAGGVWMARGMNLITMNNKGMSDILSVMITVHATAQTAQTMATKVVPGMIAAAAALSEVPGAAEYLIDLEDEEQFWVEFSGTMSEKDTELSDPEIGTGWQAMNALDLINQKIKTAFPPAAEAQAIYYAKKNGADRAPFAWLRSGTPRPTPVFPVGRGGYTFLASEAPNCSLGMMTNLARAGLPVVCASHGGGLCTTTLIAMGIIGSIVDTNVNYLSDPTGTKPSTSVSVSPDSLRYMTNGNGQSLQSLLDEYKQQQNDSAQQAGTTYTGKTLNYNGASFFVGGTLQWPPSPPLPMILTDQPQPEGDAETDPDAQVNMLIVRENLQFLAFAFGKMQPSPIGADSFKNPQLASITYGQTDVYNPKDWSMFNQNWRARLARATLMSGKWNDAQQSSGGVMPAASGANFTYVNLH